MSVDRAIRAPRSRLRVDLQIMRDGEIVGQLEMIARDDPPDSGYVNLFYLTPAARGQRLGDALHDYVTHVFGSRGVRVLRLHVSPTNERATRYYRRHGWHALKTHHEKRHRP